MWQEAGASIGTQEGTEIDFHSSRKFLYQQLHHEEFVCENPCALEAPDWRSSYMSKIWKFRPGLNGAQSCDEKLTPQRFWRLPALSIKYKLLEKPLVRSQLFIEKLRSLESNESPRP